VLGFSAWTDYCESRQLPLTTWVLQPPQICFVASCTYKSNNAVNFQGTRKTHWISNARGVDTQQASLTNAKRLTVPQMADRYVGCIRPQISRQWDQQPKLLINGNQRGYYLRSHFAAFLPLRASGWTTVFNLRRSRCTGRAELLQSSGDNHLGKLPNCPT
jgi:hypothetical protein